MTIRQNTKFRREINEMHPATSDNIRDFISRCEEDSNLRTTGNMVRVIANTGLRNEEFKSLQVSDLDPNGEWLNITHVRGTKGKPRVIPIRSRTYAALIALHELNPASEFVLGDCPRTRFDESIRKLRTVAPQFARARLWTHSIRKNFEFRLKSAGIPSGIVKYWLGRQDINEALQSLVLTHEQKMQVMRRTIERFLHEL